MNMFGYEYMFVFNGNIFNGDELFGIGFYEGF